MNELMNQTFNQVDETFSAVGHDPSADSQASRRGPSADGAEGNGGGAVGGGLPRMDLSALLEKVGFYIGHSSRCSW